MHQLALANEESCTRLCWVRRQMFSMSCLKLSLLSRMTPRYFIVRVILIRVPPNVIFGVLTLEGTRRAWVFVALKERFASWPQVRTASNVPLAMLESWAMTFIKPSSAYAWLLAPCGSLILRKSLYRMFQKVGPEWDPYGAPISTDLVMTRDSVSTVTVLSRK